MNYNYTIHYQICDNVLNNIRQGNDMHEVDIEPFLGEDRRVKLAIARKLDMDGYIHRVHPQSKPFMISISVEGVQFWMDGGYKKHFEELREKYTLDSELLKTSIRTNKSIKWSNGVQLFIAVLVAIFVGISARYQVKTYQLEQEKIQNVSNMKQFQDKINSVEVSVNKNISDSSKKNKSYLDTIKQK